MHGVGGIEITRIGARQTQARPALNHNAAGKVQ
jgi:hypothetical protein